MAELRQNQKSGQGPQTLREMRAFNREQREVAVAAKTLAADKRCTLGGFMKAEYLPRAKLTLRPDNNEAQQRLLGTWLARLADRPLARITTDDLGISVLKPMLEAKRSPNTIRNTLSVFSPVWKLAVDLGVATGDNPAAKVKRPRIDTQRERFLTKAEVVALLAILKEKSVDTHDVVMLSLFSGMRIGECLTLTWADINLEAGRIFVKDTKNKHNRHAYITEEIRGMVTRRYKSQPKAAPVFAQSHFRQIYSRIAQKFNQAVNEMGLNDGLTDRRQRVVLHSLRHTFASWLVQMG